MAQVDLLWMEEDELRAVCVALVNLLRQSEVKRLICVREALEYGYREGYTDGALQLPFAIEEGDAKSLVLH